MPLDRASASPAAASRSCARVVPAARFAWSWPIRATRRCWPRSRPCAGTAAAAARPPARGPRDEQLRQSGSGRSCCTRPSPPRSRSSRIGRATSIWRRPGAGQAELHATRASSWASARSRRRRSWPSCRRTCARRRAARASARRSRSKSTSTACSRTGRRAALGAVARWRCGGLPATRSRRGPTPDRGAAQGRCAHAPDSTTARRKSSPCSRPRSWSSISTRPTIGSPCDERARTPSPACRTPAQPRPRAPRRFDLDDAARPAARRWCAAGCGSGLLALIGSGVYSVLLVLARTPGAQSLLPVGDFFRVALVVHVDLSVLVWFVALAGHAVEPQQPARRRSASAGWRWDCAALGALADGAGAVRRRRRADHGQLHPGARRRGVPGRAGAVRPSAARVLVAARD